MSDFVPFANPSLESPSVLISTRSSVVLCQIPPNSQHSRWTGTDLWGWDIDHVRMPCSLHNVNVNGQKKQWNVICGYWTKVSYLRGRELEATIKSYNKKYEKSWNFVVLEEFSKKNGTLFSTTVPEIINLAKRLPYLIDKPIPLLRTGQEMSVTLSQAQIASLLANAFLCTFPWRNDRTNTEVAKFPTINFNELFAERGPTSLEKLKCICNYFRRVAASCPSGVVTFARRVLPRKNCPDWEKSTTPILSSQNMFSETGYIERDGRGMLQVVFANKLVGGKVLGKGHGQEQARCMICPELLVTRLFTEKLEDNEALVVTGAECFNRHSGRNATFRFKRDHIDDTPLDAEGRRQCSIVLMDATSFNNSAQQYEKKFISRELMKAFASFDIDGVAKDRLTPIATGNWGCGAFNGDPRLKALLQIMAASEAGRSLRYFTFGDQTLTQDSTEICKFLEDNQVTVGQLWKILTSLVEDKLIPIQTNVYDLVRHKVSHKKLTPS